MQAELLEWNFWHGAEWCLAGLFGSSWARGKVRQNISGRFRAYTLLLYDIKE